MIEHSAILRNPEIKRFMIINMLII